MKPSIQGHITSNTAKGILVKNDAGKVLIMGNLIMIGCMVHSNNTTMIKAPLGTVFRHNKILPHGGYGHHLQQASGYEGVVGQWT